jgi:hypothetical protein
MGRYEFWTHGVDTVVEFPNKTAEVRHAGWGTLIRQAAGTDNWFHIAIPSAKIIDKPLAKMREIHLRAEVNESAQIDLIHFRDDGKLIFSKAVSFTNRVVDEVFQRDDLPIEGAISLCIHVTFLSGSHLGYIIVRSAGGAFLT